jgi:hypothetical protein
MTSDERPIIITCNENSYFNAKILKDYDQAFFFGTSKSIRHIIGKKDISLENYHYATLSKKFGWKPCANQIKPPTKAVLLLLESWVIANVPKMMPESAETKETLYDYPKAPDILHLDDNEKFKDADGVAVEIETRGERTSKGIYFLAKDVANEFEMTSLIKNISDKTSNTKLLKDTHYNFYSTSIHNVENTRQTKELYITYKGMLKILFSSRSGNAERFADWATDTLFTVQMGSEEQKEELAADIIGQPVRNVRAVFKTCAKQVPCIYRFALGTAKTLRVSMGLPDTIKDNFVIIKYGLTNSLDRRIGEHISEYEKIKGVQLGLMNFSYIDPKFLSQAEGDLKEYFKSIEIPIEYESYQELVAINPKNEKFIKKQYDYIGTEYQGAITELIIQIEKLKLELKSLNEITEYKLKDKDRIIEIKNGIIEQKNTIIKMKDGIIENMNLKNEILEMKLKT